MSDLKSQMSAFKSALGNASQKVSKKTIQAPAKSTPPPAPTPLRRPDAGNKELKRKRPEPNNIVYSQPEASGTGKNIMTQVAYAIKHLQSKEAPLQLEDLLSYLSVQHRGDEYIRTITTILRKHDKIDYDPAGLNGKGSYAFRPIHNIRTADQLLGYLQAQTTAQGLAVRELAEGWPNAEEVIRELENQYRLLVIRNKKDDHARMVWPDDPSLAQQVDLDFQDMWHKIRLPDAETIATDLEKAGLLPTNKSAAPKLKTKVPEKKTKKARKSGKTTNTHMLSILRDYSYLKK